MAKRGLQVALLIGGLALLGAAAWGVGWGAHALLDRQAAPSTATVEPAPTTTPLSPTATPVQPTAVAVSTATLRPTSTPAPTLTPIPTVIVQAGECLYVVCRRYCSGRWPADSIPPELREYAHQVAQINGLYWPWWKSGPDLYPGQKLIMPSCPQ